MFYNNKLLKFFLLAALSLIPKSSSRLICGIDVFTGTIMEMHIKFDCRKRLGAHRKCCTAHGVCYKLKMPWKECDKKYCECVHEIAEKVRGKCKNHAKNFCKIVKDNGRFVYHLLQKG
ncbi:unnamed protein product [Cylicostephanus goldi]|uniref:Phospholipase A2 domain-containing protein n=1 Tax=Cylicostephanus goldi TaxID=71465 RepID=A0A3P7NMJ9_CYLGO|nr:unnamed protein product [Cylicostephanus goldi]